MRPLFPLLRPNKQFLKQVTDPINSLPQLLCRLPEHLILTELHFHIFCVCTSPQPGRSQRQAAVVNSPSTLSAGTELRSPSLAASALPADPSYWSPLEPFATGDSHVPNLNVQTLSILRCGWVPTCWGSLTSPTGESPVRPCAGPPSCYAEHEDEKQLHHPAAGRVFLRMKADGRSWSMDGAGRRTSLNQFLDFSYRITRMFTRSS